MAEKRRHRTRRDAYSSSRAKAFTVVEVLLVVSVIGMLVTLLLPAIQASRETARKVQCLQNARDIALAIQEYNDAVGELPPSRIADRYLTWAALILPYLEKGTLRPNSLDSFANQTDALRTTPVATFLCPSRFHDSPIAISRRTVEGILGDYVAMSSTFELKIPNTDGTELDDGAIITGNCAFSDEDKSVLRSWSSRTGYSQITDGLSCTFLIAEESLWGVGWGSIYDGEDRKGGRLGDESYPEEVRYMATRLKAFPVSQFDGDGAQTWVGAAHNSVFHVAMADGSSHAVNKRADLSVLERLVTRSGGESTVIGDVGPN